MKLRTKYTRILIKRNEAFKNNDHMTFSKYNKELKKIEEEMKNVNK